MEVTMTGPVCVGSFEVVENEGQVVEAGTGCNSDSEDWTMVDFIDPKTTVERRFPWQQDPEPEIPKATGDSSCSSNFEIEVIRQQLKIKNLGLKARAETIKMRDDYIKILKNDRLTHLSTIQSKCEMIEHQKLTIESQRRLLVFKDNLIHHQSEVIAEFLKDKIGGFPVPDEKSKKPQSDVNVSIQNLTRERMDYENLKLRAFKNLADASPQGPSKPNSVSSDDIQALTDELRNLVRYMAMQETPVAASIFGPMAGYLDNYYKPIKMDHSRRKQKCPKKMSTGPAQVIFEKAMKMV